MYQLFLPLDSESAIINAMINMLQQFPAKFRILSPKVVAYEIAECRPFEEILLDRRLAPDELETVMFQVSNAAEEYMRMQMTEVLHDRS